MTLPPKKIWRILSGLLQRRPLLIILLAHALFSIGIWNACDGYGEETNNVRMAFHAVQSHRPSSSLYSDVIALTLRYFTPDPVVALTLLKYLSSLMATVALYLALSAFSGGIRRSAIVFACLVWIASSLDAPYLQSTSLSLFTFAIMLFGIDCLLLRWSIAGVLGFYFFGLLAASLHPEYLVPVVLLTFFFVARAVRRGCWSWKVAICFALLLTTVFWVHPPAPVLKKLKHLDNYALLGLGQCYADFYHREHPEAVFNPMTEYQDLLNREFNKPTGFCAAVKNNPREALRYFTLNAGRNLFWNVPSAFLDRYREQTARYHHGVLYWAVRAILLAGTLLGIARFYRAGFKTIFLRFRNNAEGRAIMLFLALLTTSFVAVVLLVGTSRYYLCWAPIFYLGVAYCADTLLRQFNLIRYEPQLIVVAFVIFCAPNFLASRPNYEFDAVRHVAASVKEYPVIGASWAEPDAVIALDGKATAISLWDGIHQADIENGKIDILLIDQSFRTSETWADQRDFFEHFERQPETCGFKKAIGIPTGRFDIYYKPASTGPD
jgi:hypothetical protein